MAAPRNSSPLAGEQELITTLLGFRYDPEGFVRYAFPWGVKGTPLERLDRSRVVDVQVRRVE